MAVARGYLQGAAVIYELTDAETVVGRSPACDIVLTHSRSVSGQHARIVINPHKPRSAYLLCLHSLNGTFVNDARVHHDQVPLHSGDVIRFGYDTESYRFYFPQDLPRTLLGLGGDGHGAEDADVGDAGDGAGGGGLTGSSGFAGAGSGDGDGGAASGGRRRLSGSGDSFVASSMASQGMPSAHGGGCCSNAANS